MLRQGADLRPGRRHARATRTSSPAACSSASSIAMALATDPSLLILDEPTTGLDATVEAEVLDLVSALRAEFGTRRALHQPQPRHHRAHVRPRRRALRRPAGRGRPGDAGLPRPAPPVHRRPAPLPAARRACARTTARLDTIPGSLPPIGARPARLRLRRPLRARAGRLPHGGAAADRRRPGARQPLPLPRAGARPAALDARDAGGDPPPDRRTRPTVRMAARWQDLPAGRPRGPRARRHHARRLRARRWAWSASRAAARRPSRASLLGLTAARRGQQPRARRAAPRRPHRRARRATQVRAIQIVFQNPDAALNRRHSVRRCSAARSPGCSG